MKFARKNKLLVVVLLTYVFLFIVMSDKAIQSGKNSMYYVIEMLEIMPVIFILTSLIEAWVPRNVIMNNLGERAGGRGAVISFALGSFSAGPIYAAFPVCKMLLKKGASIFNIVIILSTWAVVKVPMLANEAKFLGVQFMGIRWVFTTISIVAMAYILSIIIKKEDIPLKDKRIKTENGILDIKKQYCTGCGVCAKTLSEYFLIEDGKALLKKEKVDTAFLEDIEKTIEKCPVKAIQVK